MTKPQKKIPDNHYKLFVAVIIAGTVFLTVVLGLWINGSSKVANTKIKNEMKLKEDKQIIDYLESSATK